MEKEVYKMTELEEAVSGIYEVMSILYLLQRTTANGNDTIENILVNYSNALKVAEDKLQDIICDVEAIDEKMRAKTA